jgi:hypothetical protein
MLPEAIAIGVGIALARFLKSLIAVGAAWWTAAKEWIAGFSLKGVASSFQTEDGKTDWWKVAEVAARTGLAIATKGISEAIIFLGKKVWDGLKEGFSGEFATGGYVDRTGMALVHQGERIIPASGASTGTASMLAGGGGGGGVNLTINTNVVDPNAIPALVREIERAYGSWGRGSSPLFSGA